MLPLNLTAYKLAKDTHIQPARINQIIHEKRSISFDTALQIKYQDKPIINHNSNFEIIAHPRRIIF